MEYNTIHETVIVDILNTLKEGIRKKDNILRPRSNVATSSSLTKATSALTLVFPVLCSDTLSVDIATMIAKAIERKNITLLQMAFSAYNITNSSDAIGYLEKFHTNLNLDKLNLDKFMDIMNNLEGMRENFIMISKQDIATITEDCKRNISYTFDENINDSSLLEFSQVTNYGKSKIVREFNMYRAKPSILTGIDTKTGISRYFTDDEVESLANGVWPPSLVYGLPTNPTADDARELLKWKRDTEDRNHKRDIDDKGTAYQNSRDKVKDKSDQDKLELDKNKALGQASDQKRQYFQNQLLPSDVKKANEMQPSLMLIQFYISDQSKSLNIAQQAVVGVKSKLYPIPSSDIVNKIITKHIDNDTLLKLVKVSTREISFVKDFLLGLDDAKLDALSKSRKGSASKIFKALEKRAIKGKIRKSLRMENAAKAITTLAISMEEVDELKKYNNIDVMNPGTIIPIMEKLNLLYFVVVDTTSEAIHILSDGETVYEEYSFTSLERENGDGTYKKVINLLTKMA